MIKRLFQIIVLLLPFLLFLFIYSCSSEEPTFDEFVVTKDFNLIEMALSGKNLEFVEHRRTSIQQFRPSESELKEPRYKIDRFPSINSSKNCNDVFFEIESSMRNYPLFIIDTESNVVGYLVKFRNTTGILSANQKEIPVILLEDFKIYFGC